MPNLQRQQQQQDRTRHPVRHLRGPPDADAKQMEQEAMTPTQRAAMEQALADMMSFEAGTGGLYRGEFAESIAALSAALAEQPAEQEWDGSCVMGHCGSPSGCEIDGYCRVDRCSAPPPRREVTLTDEEIDALPWEPSYDNPMTLTEGLRDFARAVIKAYKTKQGEQT